MDARCEEERVTSHVERLASRPLFLLGMPRSGTTWLSQIFESSPDFVVRLSPNYSYTLKNQLDLGASRNDWSAQLSAALVTSDPFMTQNWRRETGELETFPSRPLWTVGRLAIKDTRFHSLYQRAMELFDEAQLIYLVRHPAGAINSWWRSKEFPDEAGIASEWRSGACRKKEGPGEYWGFDDWCSLTDRYLHLARQAPSRYRVCQYEILVRNPERVATELFAFAGYDLCPTTREFLLDSQSRHDDRTYSVFKDPSVVDRWRSELPEAIQETIRIELAETPLARFAS